MILTSQVIEEINRNGTPYTRPEKAGICELGAALEARSKRGKVTHALKTWPPYFEAIRRGEKTFEVRRNDRDFRLGDKLLLLEFGPLSSLFSGREIKVEIKYILTGEEFGISPGFSVIGFSLSAYFDNAEA